MKIAILTTGNFEDMKGIMNYVQEKARNFKNADDKNLQTDVFFVISIMSGVLRFIYKCLGKQGFCGNYKSGEVVEKEGIKYILLVRKINILNILQSLILNQFVPNRTIKEFISFLGEYDFISTHQLPCHYVAEELKRKCKIPYIATWHGSDINISPKQSKRVYKTTKLVMESADMNFFVSKGLMKASDYISTNASKNYIYTGPASFFRKFSTDEKMLLRKKYMVTDKKVVMFVGNLIPVKNVMLLPQIFAAISEKAKGLKIVYWIIGDGYLQHDLECEISKMNVEFKMFGKKEPYDMPIYMNMADILIVPSTNEGFSLVALEARTCGCYVVASNVGGLPESVGQDNCFPLDDDFVNNISNKAVDVLNKGKQAEPLSDEMSWGSAIKKEINEMNRILELNNIKNRHGY